MSTRSKALAALLALLVAASPALSDGIFNPGGSSGGSSLTALTPLASVPKSGDWTTVLANCGSSIDETTGSSADATVTLLSAVTAGAGCLQWVAKVDSGPKKVIVTDGVTPIRWLSNQNDTVIVRSDGTNWAVYWQNIAPRVEDYTVAGSFTWTKAPGAKTIWAGVIGGGGGGGSGARVAVVQASGGAGGQSGSYTPIFYNAATLAATEPVIVGAGGAGAASQTTDSTAGITGGLPSVSSFGQGTYIIAAGRNSATGVAPTVGSTGGQIGAVSVTGTNTSGRFAGTVATAGVNGTGVPNPPVNVTVAGAGGAAGAGNAPVTAANVDGGAGSPFTWGKYAIGAVGGIGASKTNAVSGGQAILDFGITAGLGGGGGWANADGTAGAGSAGTACGGGGGGGGTSQNGNASGAGGNGADGCAKVITWFQ